VSLGAGDDGVHHLQRGLILQRRVKRVVDTRDRLRGQALVRVRQPEALKPKEAISAMPSSRLICHSPWGAQFGVSIPNQLVARMTWSEFLESRIRDPFVCSHPVGAAASAGNEAAVTATATSRRAAPSAYAERLRDLSTRAG